jgi:cytosine/adenosine deaminase-related metal-dependent hydrolase
MDAAGTVSRGDLLVQDDRIAAVGAAVPGAMRGKPDDTFDASGCFVIPGLIHGHVHLCQTLFRGLAEQSDLLAWLSESIWPMEAAHTEESIAASVDLGLCQLVAGGVSCVNDMGSVRHTAIIGAALEASGVRAVFGKALMDEGDGVPQALVDDPEDAVAEALELAERFDGAGGGRLRVSLAPRFILSCSEDLWRRVARASSERGMLVHTHLAESPGEGDAVKARVGTTAARYFEDRGVLGPHLVAAHGVWLDHDELALLARRDAALVHCPTANLKLGSGTARVGDWREHGIRRGIGADGAACNNHLDTFREMSLAANLSRAVRPGGRLGDREVLALATCDGARALGLGGETGSLEAGKAADVAVVDAAGVHQGPSAANDPYTTLVHATHASDVRLTMVAGRVLYRDGEWTTLDPDRVARVAARESQDLRARVARGIAA